MAEGEIIVAEQALPDKLFIVPLLGKPIFPGIFTPIMITSNDDIEIVNQAMENDKVIGLILLKKKMIRPPDRRISTRLERLLKLLRKSTCPTGASIFSYPQ